MADASSSAEPLVHHVNADGETVATAGEEGDGGGPATQDAPANMGTCDPKYWSCPGAAGYKVRGQTYLKVQHKKKRHEKKRKKERKKGKNNKVKFTIFSNHSGSLLRQQPGAEVQGKAEFRVLSLAQHMCSAVGQVGLHCEVRHTFLKTL